MSVYFQDNNRIIPSDIGRDRTEECISCSLTSLTRIRVNWLPPQHMSLKSEF
jgi:hypothetical protein